MSVPISENVIYRPDRRRHTFLHTEFGYPFHKPMGSCIRALHNQSWDSHAVQYMQHWIYESAREADNGLLFSYANTQRRNTLRAHGVPLPEENSQGYWDMYRMYVRGVHTVGGVTLCPEPVDIDTRMSQRVESHRYDYHHIESRRLLHAFIPQGIQTQDVEALIRQFLPVDTAIQQPQRDRLLRQGEALIKGNVTSVIEVLPEEAKLLSCMCVDASNVVLADIGLYMTLILNAMYKKKSSDMDTIPHFSDVNLIMKGFEADALSGNALEEQSYHFFRWLFAMQHLLSLNWESSGDDGLSSHLEFVDKLLYLSQAQDFMQSWNRTHGYGEQIHNNYFPSFVSEYHKNSPEWARPVSEFSNILRVKYGYEMSLQNMIALQRAYENATDDYIEALKEELLMFRN